MLNYGLAGRSQNVLFNLYLNLYLLDTKIEYKKKIDILYSDPLPDLRPDLSQKRLDILLSPMCLVFNNSKKPQSFGVL